MKDPAIITLTTDFGLRDPYVAMMKGVILSINPAARIVDISHQVKPGDIGHAAAILSETLPYFPKGTIHVAVIDPGVGTGRRPLVVRAENHLFSGPDNGLFWPILQACPGAEVIHLTETGYFLPQVTRTFHGRDIFAPVAAHLSRGTDPRKMGKIINDPVRLQMPSVDRRGNAISGRVVRMDHFGNLITNIGREDLLHVSEDGTRMRVTVGDLTIGRISGTYADANEGELLALIGSSGFLEIAVNQGRASDRLEVDAGGWTGLTVVVEKTGP